MLLEELAERDVDLVALHHSFQRPKEETCARLRANESFEVRAKSDIRAIASMRRLIEKHRPDLVHAFSHRGLAAAVLATIGMKQPPAIMSFRCISTRPSLLDPANHITFFSRRVPVHACETDAAANGLVAAGIARDRCHTVYNCVHQPDRMTPATRAEIRARFGIPADAFVIFTIATIRPVKGIDLLMEAALRCSDLTDVHWLIIGEQTERDSRIGRLKADPRWQGRLHMPGSVAKAGSLAGAFDLFVMPSRHEGICRAMLEAMAWGICPVVSDAGGMKEIVRHGIDGEVVPREDVAALASAIRRLHADREAIMAFGESSRKRMADLCTPRAFADRVLDLHARVAA